MSRFIKLTVAATMTIGVMGMAQTAFAHGADTAYLPFIVNVDAVVKAEREGAETVSINVSANMEDTLKIPLGSTTNVRHRPQNAPGNAPIITYNQRGMVSVNLPAQAYQNAEVSLYTINGRRILRTNADANVSQTAKSISRPNLVAGVYLISIMGTNGQTVSNRLTHRGGNLNINIAFRGNDYSPAVLPTTTALSRQAAANAFENWTITVSAEKFIDSTYQFNVVENVNPTQDIILRPNGNHFNPNIRYGSFCDPRDDQVYRTVIIGELMATGGLLRMTFLTVPGHGAWAQTATLRRGAVHIQEGFCIRCGALKIEVLKNINRPQDKPPNFHGSGGAGNAGQKFWGTITA